MANERRAAMKWWPYLTFREIVGILLVLAIVGALFFWQLALVNRNIVASGFGPGWDCVYPGRGGPVCVKAPTKAGNSN
jgi:hypothetical protein